MKKIGLIIISLIMVFVITGCEANETNNSSSKNDNYTLYEWQRNKGNYIATSTFKYDENGKLMYLGYTKTIENSKTLACDSLESEKEKYPVDLSYAGVEMTCNDENSISSLTQSMTNKSVEAGYLEDEDIKLTLQYLYKYASNEDMAKEYFEEIIEEFKEVKDEGVDEKWDHIIIANENVSW